MDVVVLVQQLGFKLAGTLVLTGDRCVRNAVLVPVHVAPDTDDAAIPTSAVLPLPPAAALPTQRVAHSAGVIELDIAGAQLRRRFEPGEKT